MLDLAIVIVNFNTRKFLRNCLTSIYNSRGDFTFEVCVVDNASLDGSNDMVQAEFPQAGIAVTRVRTIGRGVCRPPLEMSCRAPDRDVLFGVRIMRSGPVESGLCHAR